MNRDSYYSNRAGLDVPRRRGDEPEEHFLELAEH